jgi:hypothetical protein
MNIFQKKITYPKIEVSFLSSFLFEKLEKKFTRELVELLLGVTFYFVVVLLVFVRIVISQNFNRLYRNPSGIDIVVLILH